MKIKQKLNPDNYLPNISYIIIDENEIVIECSDAFLKLFEVTLKNILNKKFDAVLTDIGFNSSENISNSYNSFKENNLCIIEIFNETFCILPAKEISGNKKIVEIIKVSEENLNIYSKNEKMYLPIINEIFEGFNENENLDELMNIITSTLFNSKFNFYNVSIFLLDDTKEYIYLASIDGENCEYYTDEYPDGYFQKADSGIIGSVVQSKKLLYVENVNEFADYLQVGNSKTLSELCLPILNGGEIYGVLNLETKISTKFDQKFINILKDITYYLGIAINKQILIFKLEKQKEEQGKFIVELQESKERIENQTFDIIEKMEEIENARKLIAKQNDKIQSELEIAGALLKKLLPPKPEIDSMNFGIWFEPSASLGGDFFDFKMIDDSKLLFIQIDVTGHGVSSALLAAQSKMAFQTASNRYKSPGTLLEDLNYEFKNLNDTDLFFSAFTGLIDFKNKKLYYSNAAHPFPVLFKKNETVELDTDGFLVGVLPGMTYENKEIDLEKDDILIVYTDGLVEARNKKDEMYNTSGLIDFVAKKKDSMELQPILKSLIQDIKKYSNNSVDDDLTVLAFQIK